MGILEETVEYIVRYLPNLMAAVLVLLLGWFLAWLVSSLVRKILTRMKVDERLASGTGEERKTGVWISRGIFWFILLLALIPFFAILRLTPISESLRTVTDEVFAFLPRLLAAGLLLLVAWILAGALRLILSRALKAIKLDERFSKTTEQPETQKLLLSKTIANAAYWLVFLLFLPAVLNALAVEGILAPVEAMIHKVLAFLPNLFAAGLILLVGWFLARIVCRIVTNVLAAVGVDRLSEELGLAHILKSCPLSKIIGLIVYILILIPIVISSLDALRLEGITRPASDMLEKTLAAIPLIFGASVILAIAYVVGRLVAGLCTKLLIAVNFNTLSAKLGLGEVESEGKWAPCEIAGHLILVIIMLFASVSALSLLGFSELANLVTRFIALAGHIIIGLIIFALGLYLANLAAKIIQSRSIAQAKLLATVARIAILLLAGAMALRQMGLANEIIALAFGLLLGAVAVAAAIAFGIGGRDIASRKLDEWTKSIESKSDKGKTQLK